jgi:hypothetical protein
MPKACTSGVRSSIANPRVFPIRSHLCYELRNTRPHGRSAKSAIRIYLLHEITPSAFKRLGLMTSDDSVAWVTWAGSFLLLALISLVPTP